MKLNFCQTCGAKRVRDVQQELRKLLTNHSMYQPDLCGICMGTVDNHQKKLRRKVCEKVVVKKEIVSEDDVGNGIGDIVSGDETDEYQVESNSSHSGDDEEDEDQEGDEDGGAAKQIPVIQSDGLKSDFQSIASDLDPNVAELMEEADDPKQCFKCKYCKKQFAYMSSFLHHITKHPGVEVVEKPYKCNLCESAFDRRFNLKTHRRKHSEYRPFKCNFPPCTNTFKDKHTLAAHEKTHTGVEKRHQCEYCSKVFRTHTMLITHNRIHTGDKPFMCKFCGFCCTQQQNLVIHERQHTRERPFQCKLCSKSFFQGVQLQRHEMDHTGARPFVCEICGHTCKAKSYLKQHLNIHRAERPYKCDKCDFTSKRKSNILSHQNIHKTEKSFECLQCHKLFKHKHSLTKHKKRYCSRDGDDSARVQRKRKEKQLEDVDIKPPPIQMSKIPKDLPVIIGGSSLERLPPGENRMLIPPHHGYTASSYNSMGILTHHVVTHPQPPTQASVNEFEPVDVVFNML